MKYTHLTPELLSSLLHHQHTTHHPITKLNLSHQAFTSDFSALISLRHTLLELDLSHNRITGDLKLNKLHNLIVLNVSHNRIAKISNGGMGLPTRLQHLDLTCNLIIDWKESLENLKRECPSLEYLSVDGDDAVLERLMKGLWRESLKTLNGVAISIEDDDEEHEEMKIPHIRTTNDVNVVHNSDGTDSDDSIHDDLEEDEVSLCSVGSNHHKNDNELMISKDDIDYLTIELETNGAAADFHTTSNDQSSQLLDLSGMNSNAILLETSSDQEGDEKHSVSDTTFRDDISSDESRNDTKCEAFTQTIDPIVGDKCIQTDESSDPYHYDKKDTSSSHHVHQFTQTNHKTIKTTKVVTSATQTKQIKRYDDDTPLSKSSHHPNNNTMNQHYQNDKEKNDLVSTLQDKCAALQSLLDLCDKGQPTDEISSSSSPLLQLWRTECYKAILAKLQLKRMMLSAQRQSHASDQTLKRTIRRYRKQEETMNVSFDRMKEKCIQREKLGNAKVREVEMGMKCLKRECEGMKRDVEEAWRVKRKSELVCKGVVEWAERFTRGYCTKRLVDDDDDDRKDCFVMDRKKELDERGASIVQSFSTTEENPVMARERAMKTAISLLDTYEERLCNITSVLKLIGTSFALRDARLRNGEAALAAEKMAFEEGLVTPDEDASSSRRTGRYSSKIHRGDLKQQQKQQKGLPVEAEALMRGCFKQLDRSQIGGECGKVQVSRLLRALEGNIRITRLMNKWMQCEKGWESALASLKCRLYKTQHGRSRRQSDPDTTVTWGEFLVCFLPNAASELDSYREMCSAVGVSPLPVLLDEISISAGEEAYSINNNRERKNAPETEQSTLETAHLELVLPPSHRQNTASLPSLSRMTTTSLRRLAERLAAERSWLMETLHSLCVRDPINIAHSARKSYEMKLSDTIQTLTQRAEILRQMEKERNESNDSLAETKRSEQAYRDEVIRWKEKCTRMNDIESSRDHAVNRCTQLQNRVAELEAHSMKAEKIQTNLRRQLSKANAKTKAALNELGTAKKQSFLISTEYEQKVEHLTKHMEEKEEEFDTTTNELSNAKETLDALKKDHDLLRARWEGLMEGKALSSENIESFARIVDKHEKRTDDSDGSMHSSRASDESHHHKMSSENFENSTLLDKLNNLAALTDDLLEDDDEDEVT